MRHSFRSSDLEQLVALQKASGDLLNLRDVEQGLENLKRVRHGDQVDLAQLQIRTLSGATPDGITGKMVDSTRWLNNEDLLAAVKQAQSAFNASGGTQKTIAIDLGKIVGDGYYAGTTSYAKATAIKVILDAKGMPITAYPVLP